MLGNGPRPPRGARSCFSAPPAVAAEALRSAGVGDILPIVDDLNEATAALNEE